MTQSQQIGSSTNLKLTIAPSAFAGSLILWALLSSLAAGVLHVPLTAAIVGGAIAVLLHWCSDIAHQLGHAWAARTTGHPMTGIRLWWLLSSSLYPANEGSLPAAVHIRRALGGPIASLVVTLVAGLVVLLLPNGSAAWWVALFCFLDNLLVLTLGAFVPLGFTDGSTLLYWWGKQ